MRILSLEDEPFHELRYLNAAKRGGTEVCRLPIVRGQASRLPAGCEAVILTSDLQGMAPSGSGPAVLLGVALAAFLEELAFDGELPAAERTGIILAGDLFSVPEANKRGGHGDVTDVWECFAAAFAWTLGVAGNHDHVEGLKPVPGRRQNAQLLDGDVVEEGGVRFAGVSYVAGRADRTGRRDLDDQLALVDLVLEAKPDVLVLHEGPGVGRTQPGSAYVSEHLLTAEMAVPLVVCGHVHWDHALASLPRDTQVLNVDSRVVVLTCG